MKTTSIIISSLRYEGFVWHIFMHVVKYVMEKLISLGAIRSGYLLMLMLAEHNISNLLLYFMCVCLCVPMGPVAGTE